MYVIYICDCSVGTLTTLSRSYRLELTTEMSATLSSTIRTLSIFGEIFLLVRNI
jgi:hypothetical protein